MEWCIIVGSPCFPVVLALFLESCSKIGLVKAMGILFGPVSVSIPWNSADLGIALGLFFAVGLFSTPIVASVITRITRPRLLLILGATIGSSPIILTSLATSKLHLFIVFAISGTGFSILRITCMTALDRLAGENFNLFFSLSTCGYSVGMVVFPLLAEELLIAYDWRGVLLILGGIMLHAIPCTTAIRITPADLKSRDDVGLQRRDPVDTSSNPGLEAGTDNDHDDVVKDTCRAPLLTPSKRHDMIVSDQTSHNNDFDHKNCLDDMTSIPGKMSSWYQSTEFFADPFSLFIILSNAVLIFVYNGWHAFLVPHALQRGISPRNTIIITFVAALGNLSIRLTVASLTHKLVDPINLHLGLTVLNIFSLACDAFLPNFYVMLVTSFCSAAAIAGRGVVGILVIRNRVSSENLPMALSVTFVLEGIGFFLGGYLSGLMADMFSSYDATFKLLAAVDVLTFIFMLYPKLVKKPNVSL